MRARDIPWIVVFAVGCGEEAKKQPAPEPAIAETRLPSEAGDIVLRLLDQGVEPRRVLQYDLRDWKGGKAAMEMQMSMAMKEPETRMDVPPVRMVMTYSPVVETADGNLRAEFAMELAESAPGDPLAGVNMDMKGWTVMTPSGQVKDIGFELPEDTSPPLKQTMDGLRQTLRQLATPFPALPVGKGARWELIAPMQVMGIQFEARAAYRLEEVTEQGGRTALAMSITASGAFAVPGTEVTAKIESMQAEGTGTFAFDLKSLIPESTMETRMAIKVSVGEEKTIEQDLTMRMKMSRAE
jgi:hypothetical protein